MVKKQISLSTIEKLKSLESNQQSTEVKSPGGYGTRHTQLLLLFLIAVIAYGMRVNLSVGIVAMTDPTATEYNHTTYNWDDKSVVLSSFFWGYVIPQISAGHLARTYGTKWFLTASIGINSIFSILIPFMADFGSWGVMVCRIIQGFFQGAIFPCVHSCLSKWVPISERSRMGTFVYAGGPFGTVISMPVTGWIAGSSLGWPYVFYLYGILGGILTIIWLIFSADSPATSKTISKEEKDFIEQSIGSSSGKKEVPTPWKKIFTSLPVWAVLVGHCGQNWGFWTLLTEIPSYMGHVLNYDIKSNGLLSAAPYLTLWILSFVFSLIADVLINRKIFSLGTTRKITNSIGLCVPALALLGLTFISPEDKGLALGLLIIAVGANSATYCGFQINHIDLSPNHASTLMGITNSVSNICSIIAPLLVQFIVTDESDESQWAYVFYTAAAIYVITNAFFCMFGSGEEQPWNGHPSDDEAPTPEALSSKRHSIVQDADHIPL